MDNLLKEAQEYKFSQELFDSIMDVFPRIAGKQSIYELTLKQPNSLIYETQKIKIGFAIYLLLNHMNVHQYQLPQFLDVNKLEISAEQIINNSYSGFKIRIAGFIPPDDPDADATMGMAVIDKEINLYVYLNEILINNRQRFANTLRHELQHLTALVNAISLVYYRRLKKANFDLTALEKLDSTNTSKEEQFYIREKIVKSKIKIRNKKSKEEFKSYLEDPKLSSYQKKYRAYVTSEAEYRQHLSDILSGLTKNILGQGIFSDNLTDNYLETLYRTFSKNNIKKGTDHILANVIQKYDSVGEEGKGLYRDSMGEAFNQYMSSPHIRKAFIADLKRYLPVRIKTLFDNIYGDSYTEFPASQEERKRFLSRLKTAIGVRYGFVMPGTYE